MSVRKTSTRETKKKAKGTMPSGSSPKADPGADAPIHAREDGRRRSREDPRAEAPARTRAPGRRGSGPPSKDRGGRSRETSAPTSASSPRLSSGADPDDSLVTAASVPEVLDPADIVLQDEPTRDELAGHFEDALEDDPKGLEDGGRAHGLDLQEPAVPASRETAGALVRSDPLTRYRAEVRRYPPLERDEELRLARAFRESGDRDAAARLITSNLALVIRIAGLFRRAVTNVLDLIQEGNIGLIQALERFDPEVGVRFSTYAGWWIKAYMLKYLLDNVRMVRVGTTNARRRLLYNLQREKRRLEAQGISPGPKLLAERFGVSEKDVVEVERTLTGPDVSLDAPVGESGGSTHGDSLVSRSPSVEDEVARRELKDLLDSKIALFRGALSPRDAQLLDERLLADEPATLQEIGDRFGVTREAVRQAEKRLTDRLRSFLVAELGEEAVLQFRTRT